jgi:hypothetical protein
MNTKSAQKRQDEDDERLMEIENPRMSYIRVDGLPYGFIWQDRGDHLHLKVFFESGRLIGFKNFSIGVDTGDGVVSWTIRRLMCGVKFTDGFDKTKT